MLYSENRRLIQDNWMCSEKLDGVRGFWNGQVMVTRNGFIIDIPKRIRDSLSTLHVDGEFWGEKHLLGDIVNAIQSKAGSGNWKDINFYVFDVHNKDIFIDRYNKVKEYPFFCKQSYINKRDVPTTLESICMNGGEGLIIRNPTGEYKNYGRSKDVTKVKPIMFGEAVFDVIQSLFIETETGINFKMKYNKDKAIPNLMKVKFQYTGRTTKNKPKYPKIISYSID